MDTSNILLTIMFIAILGMCVAALIVAPKAPEPMTEPNDVITMPIVGN